MKKDDQTTPLVLQKLAYFLGTEIKRRKLEIPNEYGNGYCSGFVFNAHMRMLISNYELNQDVVIDNLERDDAKKVIFFKFQNIFPRLGSLSMGTNPKEIPTVLIGTSRINTDEIISIHSNTSTINIEVEASYLSKLFSISAQSSVLQSLLQNTQPYLFEQIISPSLQKVVDEIVSETVDETFELFFRRIKAEEMICRLLMELEKRDEKCMYALSNHDIAILYRIKDQILDHLETPPVIGELALEAAMSPTKLKRLFRQIFGDSIFSYYQKFRIKKAALLLEEKKYSVSEVGYKLGFTNLSHFSKVFKEHFGINPKQYTMINV
ncbi:AraC family transcriptional regulator [Sphingobacterium sp. BIGb0165]|uniref:helix-turn-helix domain-containing protein n=1 Tax=Sphingobacterium sp. BIGb0165 TaxID=2940615 RepID=UPI002168F572|nr:AraC family transcriptional regulator [Sphingobacterium sp. BIGb0165]MCS4224523.1 AraC-like DNA-binding protein [Sphingobacterium sp. BIGb0165]